MGLKDLVRRPEADSLPASENVDAAAEAFISGAPVKATPPSTTSPRRGRPPKKLSERRKSIPTTFALEKRVSRDIDRIALLPRNLKVSRSDVVRAGVVALQEMDKDQLLALLERISRSEVIDDSDTDE